MAADRLQDKIAGLLVEICLIQKRTVFRVEVELDVPITIFFRSRFYNDSRDGKTRIDDLQAIFGRTESAVIDVRPEGLIARWASCVFGRFLGTRGQIIAASNNAE